MRSARTMMKSTLMIAPLTMLLAACGHVPLAVAPPVIITSCPNLEAPPEVVVDVLAAAAELDADASDWVIGLDQHYDALDVCNAD